MKKFSIFLAVFLLLALSASALDIITATVTVTNTAGTTNGQTLTVNSDTRTWTNSVQAAGSQVLTNNLIGGAVTNLFNQVANFPFAGISDLSQSGTNGIVLRTTPGGPLSVALSAGWGTVVLTTNTLGDFTVVEVPLSTYPAAQQTNIASGIVAMVGANQATNALHENAPAMTNFLGNTNTQIIAGQKIFTNSGNYFSGSIFDSDGALWAWAPGNVSRVYIAGGSMGGITNFLDSSPAGLTVSGTGPFNLGVDAFIGAHSISGLASSMSSSGFFGAGYGLTNLMGTNIYPASISANKLDTNGLYFLGTNSFPAGSDIAFGRFSISSLANGNNAGVVVGTNVVCDLSGPSGAFTINGIAGGREGKTIFLLNRTGFSLTIAHESGVEATAANRITCLTASDKTVSGNSSSILWYNPSTSRWVCLYFGQ